MKMHSFALAAASLLAVETAAAEQFQPLRDQGSFVGLVQGRDLTRFGIRLEVTPAGEIKGSAFGRPVT
nr:dihydrodipicolinate reductase [Paracoccaceae bacterium]